MFGLQPTAKPDVDGWLRTDTANSERQTDMERQTNVKLPPILENTVYSLPVQEKNIKETVIIYPQIGTIVANVFLKQFMR